MGKFCETGRDAASAYCKAQCGAVVFWDCRHFCLLCSLRVPLTPPSLSPSRSRSPSPSPREFKTPVPVVTPQSPPSLSPSLSPSRSRSPSPSPPSSTQRDAGDAPASLGRPSPPRSPLTWKKFGKRFLENNIYTGAAAPTPRRQGKRARATEQRLQVARTPPSPSPSRDLQILVDLRRDLQNIVDLQNRSVARRGGELPWRRPGAPRAAARLACLPCPMCGAQCGAHKINPSEAYCSHSLPRMNIHEWGGVVAQGSRPEERFVPARP